MNPDPGDRSPSEELMAVDVRRDGRAVVVTVSGEVDVLTAPRLRAALDDALGDAVRGPVVLDLTDVDFLASRGLGTITDAHRDAAAATPLRVVIDHNRPVIRPIQVSGLDAVLRLYDSVDDALEGDPEVDVRTER